MKNGFVLLKICLAVAIVVMASTAFGQDGGVKVSSGGNRVTVNDDGVVVRSDDGSTVKTRGGNVTVKDNSARKAAPKAKAGKSGSASTGTLVFSNDKMISGRTIVADGDGIILKGQGDYVLVDCQISAGKNAVVVSDNATVTMKNCVVEGGAAAIVIKGNGTLNASSNVINGKVKKQGNGDFVDQGENLIKS